MQQPLHVVRRWCYTENSDSWSDDTEGDLSSTGPSPSDTPSLGTSAGKKKMGRFRRTNKAKGENSSDETSSDSLERVINFKNCLLSAIIWDSTPKMRSVFVTPLWARTGRKWVASLLAGLLRQVKHRGSDVWMWFQWSLVAIINLERYISLPPFFFFLIAKISCCTFRIPPISLFRTE